MLKLKLQDFGHLMRRADSLEETLRLEKVADFTSGGQIRSKDWSFSFSSVLPMNIQG